MPAQYVLAVVAVVFLVAGGMRVARLGLAHPQGRTWLLVGAILGVVAAWLLTR